MHKYLFIFSLLTFWFISCEKQDNSSLAIVNNHVISPESFRPRYLQFLDQTHQKDNLANRHLFLNSLIDQWLIIDYAHESRLVDHPGVLREKQRMADQLLLNQYFDRQILPRTEASDSELRRLFTWSRTSLHVRHLFARDLSTIQAFQQSLEKGVPWEQLAQSSFKDSLLRQNGGDIGWMTMGDMDPAFEVAAYSLVGDEISDPVKTRYGYSIIQVMEREKDIFLTEQDYQLEKDGLGLMAAQYKKLPAVRAFTDSIEKTLGLTFDSNELKSLLGSMIHRTESGRLSRSSPLVYFKDGHVWTTQETAQRLNHLSKRQLQSLRTENNLKNAIKGLAVRKTLIREAKRFALDQTPFFTETLRQKYDAYLINLCLDDFYQSVPLQDKNRLENIKKAYQDFRNKLADNRYIQINSAQLKSLILTPKAIG